MVSLKRFFFSSLLVLGMASQANALTAVDRYVDTDCANNGDGTADSCAASGGAAGAYKSCQQAIDDIVTDNASLVTADIAVTVHLDGATADAGGDGFEGCHITGLTLDATRNLKLIVDAGERHQGVFSSSYYRIDGAYYYAPLRISENFVTIEGLQLRNSLTGAGGGTPGGGIYVDIGAVTAGRLVIDGNILAYSGDYTNQTAWGWFDNNDETSGVTKVLRNNVSYDWNRNYIVRCNSASDKCYVYNNTSYSNVASSYCYSFRGYGSGATFDAANNIAQGTCTNYDLDMSPSTTNFRTNLAEDTTSPNDTLDSKVITFVNEGSDDFHLDSGETDAIDAGTDLSGDTESFTVDVDLQTRSGSWDIGFDEIVSSASAGLATLRAMGIL